jgi:[acyl-carrier-protein] S-malonyltransferase
MKKAFIFPGQGSQKVGMGSDLFQNSSMAKERFALANEITGRDLTQIILEGPDDDLKATQNTQPALFVIESIITDLIKEKGISPDYTMGHSLGEYGALYAAGVFSFEDGLKLVAKRGELMAKAGAESEGAMAAIIGMEKSEIIKNISSVKSGTVVSANENSPEQTVISGDKIAVEEACEILKEAGAKRAIMLPVSGAFHSPLMKPAADAFKSVLDEVVFNDATCPVVTNVMAAPETNGETLKGLLIEQLLSPVRWVDSQQKLLELEVTSTIEVGPGNVLKGLARKFDRSLKVNGCGTMELVEAL